MTNIRTEKKRVKTAKGRKLSSTLWLQRQLNDPYVQQAKKDGYRSRAAYKLIELDEKFKFLKPGMKVVDLGAAPGGWTQVAGKKKCTVVGIDLLEVEPISGATLLKLDFMDETAPDQLKALLGGDADVVVSDMAPNTSGHVSTDHLRIMLLVEAAYLFACEVLAENGTFVAKVWQGGTEGEVLKDMKKRFRAVKHAKPKASRADSAEIFVVATGFRKNA
jgi:23S rRNA (uridine2552-2'-O)-methyltransferase